MSLFRTKQSSKPTQTIAETDQSLFAFLVDMVSCGGKANLCHANGHMSPAMPSRRFDDRDLLDRIFEGRVISCDGRGQNNEEQMQRVFSNERDLLDHIFEGRVLPCGAKGQNNQEQVQRVFSGERDFLDHIFEGRVLPCGPHLTGNEEQVKRWFSDRRDLLDHIFEGRVFSGGVAFPRSNSSQEHVNQLFSDKPDILDDVFEGRVLSCGSPAHADHDQVKRVFSAERDLLDHIFEGRALPCHASGTKHEEVKRVFNDERDLLDDVFEGRIFSSGKLENRCNGRHDTEKRESIDTRDLLDLELEGKMFSSVSASTSENDATTWDPVTRRDERVPALPEERGCFQTILEDFLCTCQAHTAALDHSTVPRAQVIKHNVQEERDLLDDVFEGRLCSSGINDNETKDDEEALPEKDVLDHVFENVESNVCGVGTMSKRVSHLGPDIKRNRSLIDDATTVASNSNVSRKGLGIFSPNELQPMEHQHLQKQNIIQSFLSRNDRQ